MPAAEPVTALPEPIAERVQWLSDRVAFIPTQRSFPACHSLVLAEPTGDLVLVDAGLDDEALQALEPRLESVLVTHFHLDHVAGIETLGEVPVIWNDAETGVLADDSEGILDFLGLDDRARHEAGAFVEAVYPDVPEPSQTFQPDASLEAAGLRVETIPVPGHSPGHLALKIPEEGVFFTVDVEFRGQGPWYGWPHCDPTAFEDAASQLVGELREADVVATSHSQPLHDSKRAVELLDGFVDRFTERDEAILEAIEARGAKGATLDELVDEVRLFYGEHLDVREHLRFFCRVMTQLHLERLARGGQAKRQADRWVAAN